jgi:hypothetical protein
MQFIQPPLEQEIPLGERQLGERLAAEFLATRAAWAGLSKGTS